MQSIESLCSLTKDNHANFFLDCYPDLYKSLNISSLFFSSKIGSSLFFLQMGDFDFCLLGLFLKYELNTSSILLAQAYFVILSAIDASELLLFRLLVNLLVFGVNVHSCLICWSLS